MLPLIVALTTPVAVAMPGSVGGAHGTHAGDEAVDPKAVSAVSLDQVRSLDGIIGQISGSRVIVVGETHDRLDHHLNQLAVIKALHARQPDMAIGMEFFHRPFQPVLDAYVAGSLDEADMLKQSEYFQRWRFDFRLYRPILAYAREHGIPLRALNMETEVTSAMGPDGMDGLSDELKSRLPEGMDREVGGYADRLRAVFDAHPAPPGHKPSFQRFLDVQLIWDETMADTAARWLRANPGRPMVVLAGSGHVAGRVGIPDRLERRLGERVTTILQSDGQVYAPGDADFLLMTQPRTLPPAGKLGIYMAADDEGVSIQRLAKGGGSEQAGLEEGDRLLRIAGRSITAMDDVYLAIMGKGHGETVEVVVSRSGLFGIVQRHTVMVTLKAF
ncbi:MAG: ChaN family lipoprotein [Gammaproteobacteria bacterium]